MEQGEQVEPQVGRLAPFLRRPDGHHRVFAGQNPFVGGRKQVLPVPGDRGRSPVREHVPHAVQARPDPDFREGLTRALREVLIAHVDDGTGRVGRPGLHRLDPLSPHPGEGHHPFPVPQLPIPAAGHGPGIAQEMNHGHVHFRKQAEGKRHLGRLRGVDQDFSRRRPCDGKVEPAQVVQVGMANRRRPGRVVQPRPGIASDKLPPQLEGRLLRVRFGELVLRDHARPEPAGRDRDAAGARGIPRDGLREVPDLPDVHRVLPLGQEKGQQRAAGASRAADEDHPDSFHRRSSVTRAAQPTQMKLLRTAGSLASVPRASAR